jgi:hypothetical protein
VLRAVLAVLALLLPVACRRKAPGPAECRTFALAVYGVPSEAALDPRIPGRVDVRERVDDLTRECLVVPYDRQLLRCTEETGRPRACRAAFERRRLERSGSR